MSRISVVLATFNGERYLPAQLESIASQTRPPDELLIRDDGSTDATMAILAMFRDRAPLAVSIERNTHNLGSTQNFAAAIAEAAGDVIVLADQDDLWLPGKLAAIEAAFHAHPAAGLVFSDALLIDAQGRPTGERLWASVAFNHAREVAHGNAFRVFLRRPAVTGATLALRASLRGHLLPIPSGWIHDEWLALVLAALGPVVPITEPLLSYRRHEANQVGLPPPGLRDHVRLAASRPRSAYLDRAEAFQSLRQHLAPHLAANQPDLLAEIDAKIAHLRHRGQLARHRLARLHPIARELLSGGYDRYSGSSLAGLIDLFRPA